MEVRGRQKAPQDHEELRTVRKTQELLGTAPAITAVEVESQGRARLQHLPPVGGALEDSSTLQETTKANVENLGIVTKSTASGARYWV